MNNEKINAIAKMLNEDTIIQGDEDNKFLCTRTNESYYIYTKEEAIEREFETFESCYYNDFAESFRRGALMSMTDRTYSGIRGDLGTIDDRASSSDKEFVNSMLKSMLKEPREAFDNNLFFERQVASNYEIVDTFYITAE